jgi:MarR family transcriptional regulator, lower aerobic nicotinate degradation pathway regulator
VSTQARKPGSKAKPKALDIHALPGHLIRRLQQIAVGLFLDEVGELGLTPVQFALLQTAHLQPGIDQRSAALAVGQDTSTLATVADRLESRGWLERRVVEGDRRARALSLTREGAAVLAQATPRMHAAQSRILAPLSERERASFMRLLTKLVDANNEASRAPKV